MIPKIKANLLFYVYILIFFGLNLLLKSEEPKFKPELQPDVKLLNDLKALDENSSLLLPPVKTFGEFSEEVKKFGLDKTGPQSRNYCVKWVWEPDRKRAIFCGGNAGVPHRLNDVWEFDLQS